MYLPQKIIEFKSTVWSNACHCRQVNIKETDHQRCIRKLLIANSMLVTRKGIRENTISLWRMEKKFFFQEKINRQSWEGISRAHIIFTGGTQEPLWSWRLTKAEYFLFIPILRPGWVVLPPYTVKRPILKSSLMRQIAPLEYINTLLKRSIPKKPR